ncbi:NADP-dependent oxidoreductase [Hoyosella sp. YIM 151337]|uniref:NADP-dependent oxidoreductase n=1 Tax=Hoyosella sp. YIM 151337 TaxID=2992742 RepID=UPI002236BAE1|nr:NADP-dependent oxidoreductase [Hoyosella sp. YIM 151337]MCW4354723.1 NADP-dependent oxidoreductase [Hoyosella sp. YIM 151337]
MRTNQIRLAAYPVGEPKDSDFKFTTEELPELGEGQVLLRAIYLSLDPYMRGRMSTAKSYAQPLSIGDVMLGGTVCEVLESRSDKRHAGDIVLAFTGWQTHAVADAQHTRRLDPAAAPISTALGVLGMPGFTAYGGLLEIGRPKPGETVAVAAAAGPVGSAVGQIAKIHGARAVGIAGGPEKCRILIDEFGFDAAVDHRSQTFEDDLASATPDGVDVYFENVGGHVASAVTRRLNRFARIPVCGLVAGYNDTETPTGVDRLPGFMRRVLTLSLTVRGFIQDEFIPTHQDAFLNDMPGWVRDVSVRYREDIVDGLDNAPEAFRGLLRGRNLGKLLIRVGEDPTN